MGQYPRSGGNTEVPLRIFIIYCATVRSISSVLINDTLLRWKHAIALQAHTKPRSRRDEPIL